jgi:hypothetical protein
MYRAEWISLLAAGHFRSTCFSSPWLDSSSRTGDEAIVGFFGLNRLISCLPGVRANDLVWRQVLLGSPLTRPPPRRFVCHGVLMPRTTVLSTHESSTVRAPGRCI